jgi:5-formyltetrahydrofolate cyclo-ligase
LSAASADKQALRQLYRQRRAGLKTQEIQAQAELIAVRLWAWLDAFKPQRAEPQAQVIAAYVGARGELSLDLWIEQALERGQRVALPRVCGPGQLEFVEVTDLQAQLAPGAYGLLEPLGPPLDEPLIPTALIPGVAFDLEGGRLGQGGGFYDRWLARREALGLKTLKVGVGYAWQMLDEPLTLEAHDQRMDWFICAGYTRRIGA